MFDLVVSLRCRFSVLPVVINLVFLLLNISLALSYFSFKDLEIKLKLEGFYFFVGSTQLLFYYSMRSICRFVLLCMGVISQSLMVLLRGCTFRKGS